MLEFLKGLFSVPDPNSKGDPAWQELMASNLATVFTPERDLTSEQAKLAEACIEEFRLLFGKAEDYQYDLRHFEGPFLISPDKLDSDTRHIYEIHLERSRRETGDEHFNVWLFEFRREEDVAHFFADTINGAEWVFSTLEI